MKKVEEAKKAEAEKVEPVMRGKLKKKESGQIGIEGNGRSRFANLKRGKHNRFRFTSKRDDLLESASSDGVLIVKSGMYDYSGVFLLGEGEEIRKVKESLKLEFQKRGEDDYAITGTGENEFGKFKLDGFYKPSKKKLIVNKAYEAEKDEYNFDDDDDDDEADYVDGGDAVDDEGTLDEDGELNRSEMADELAALKAEQEMSVEELRRKYGGGGDAPPAVAEEKKNEGTDVPPPKVEKKESTDAALKKKKR